MKTDTMPGVMLSVWTQEIVENQILKPSPSSKVLLYKSQWEEEAKVLRDK